MVKNSKQNFIFAKFVTYKYNISILYVEKILSFPSYLQLFCNAQFTVSLRVLITLAWSEEPMTAVPETIMFAPA